MDDSRIDFSPLDPSRDPERWRRMIDSITARALAARGPGSIPQQLLAWSRPALAMAAALTLVIWGAAWASGPEPAPQARTEPAVTLAAWAADDELPPATEILQILGGQNGSR
ncbi:MAG: hypothetical protein HYY06_10765 [Deltaproteobacteria bacterium]|nr:hypothetical protein [Deltaproteobacteria bacterium]